MAEAGKAPRRANRESLLFAASYGTDWRVRKGKAQARSHTTPLAMFFAEKVTQTINNA